MVMHMQKDIEHFFDMESLGVQCKPKCGSCKCGQCHPGGRNMSLKDEKEYQLIEKGLGFNEQKGRWCASYPWIRSPIGLPNNRCMALVVLKALENRL